MHGVGTSLGYRPIAPVPFSIDNGDRRYALLLFGAGRVGSEYVRSGPFGELWRRHAVLLHWHRFAERR
jgi:hypothetical protein